VRRPALVAFLGPSLPAAEARKSGSCAVLPPARQGDVWRALESGPRAIALVDGLFESQPSVWHREILDALSAGVAVFGGASMGALRAAELARFGMVGVGAIFRAYRDGLLVDDGEVALLHAGPEHGYHAFTVPLVNVRWAVAHARAERVLSGREAAALVAAAGRIFYMDRTWPAVLEGAGRRLGREARVRFHRFAVRGLPDLKAADARATLATARAYLRGAPALAPAVVAPAPASSLVRRRKISVAPSPPAPPGRRETLAEEGLRAALLAGLGRSLGLSPAPGDLGAAEPDWLRGARGVRRARLLRRAGMDEADARRLAEDFAVERMVLSVASRVVPDGPSPLEGLVAAARRAGVRSRRGRPG